MLLYSISSCAAIYLFSSPPWEKKQKLLFLGENTKNPLLISLLHIFLPCNIFGFISSLGKIKTPIFRRKSKTHFSPFLFPIYSPRLLHLNTPSFLSFCLLPNLFSTFSSFIFVINLFSTIRSFSYETSIYILILNINIFSTMVSKLAPFLMTHPYLFLSLLLLQGPFTW